MPYTITRLGTYALPNPCLSSADLDRTTSLDLQSMDRRELRAERYSLQRAWTWGVRHHTREYISMPNGPDVYVLTWIENRMTRIDALLKLVIA